MEGGTLRFSSNGSKLGAVLANGTYIWSTQTGNHLNNLSLGSIWSTETDYHPNALSLGPISCDAAIPVLEFCVIFLGNVE